MTKRASEDTNYKELERKIRKLERKVKKNQRQSRSRTRSNRRGRRRHRSRSINSDARSLCETPSSSSRQGYEDCEYVDSEKANSLVEMPLIDDARSLKSVVVAVTAGTDLAATPGAAVADPSAASAPAASTDAAAAPSPALICQTQSTEMTNAIDSANTEVSELDNTILEILGIDPTQENVFGKEIQRELAVRLEHFATNGLTKEDRKDLKEKYLVPINCKMISAPILNAELKATLTEIMANRDKAIETKQVQLASAIAALGQVLTRLFSNKNKDSELIKTLMDACRILCDCQHSDSIRRRGLVLSALRKDVKNPIISTKIDHLLFGQGLAETLKTTKAINKSSTELKATPAPKPPLNKNPAHSNAKALNWKSPFPTRRQVEPLRTKVPAPTKYRQLNSSRPSQQRPQRNRRR